VGGLNIGVCGMGEEDLCIKFDQVLSSGPQPVTGGSQVNIEILNTQAASLGRVWACFTRVYLIKRALRLIRNGRRSWV